MTYDQYLHTSACYPYSSANLLHFTQLSEACVHASVFTKIHFGVKVTEILLKHHLFKVIGGVSASVKNTAPIILNKLRKFITDRLPSS